MSICDYMIVLNSGGVSTEHVGLCPVPDHQQFGTERGTLTGIGCPPQPHGPPATEGAWGGGGKEGEGGGGREGGRGEGEEWDEQMRHQYFAVLFTISDIRAQRDEFEMNTGPTLMRSD